MSETRSNDNRESGAASSVEARPQTSLPGYVVVEGPIGVGKTTLARRIADAFGSDMLLEAAEENPFLEKFYENPRSAALPTQLHFLLQRARQMRALDQQDLFNPVRVSDFLLEKDRIFAELTLDPDELDLYDQVYAQLTLNAQIPDLVVYLQAPVEVLLERINKRGIAYEQWIEAAYLERLCDAYIRFFYQYNDAPLLIVNAADIDFANNESDFRLLLDRIVEHRRGRQYFNPESSLSRDILA